MKKIFMCILCVILVFGCMNINSIASEKTSMTEVEYKVYNGFGELIYVADSLEEAECYLEGQNMNSRSERGLYQIAKLVVKSANKTVGVITAACVIYRVGDWLFSDGEVIDIVNVLVSTDTIMEIYEWAKELRLYSNTTALVNPYPPNSYQGVMWIKNTFSYIVGP